MWNCNEGKYCEEKFSCTARVFHGHVSQVKEVFTEDVPIQLKSESRQGREGRAVQDWELLVLRPYGKVCLQACSSASQPMHQCHLTFISARRAPTKDAHWGCPIIREGEFSWENDLEAKVKTSMPKHWFQFSASWVQQTCTKDSKGVQGGAIRRLALDWVAAVLLTSHVISNMSLNLSEFQFSHL